VNLIIYRDLRARSSDREVVLLPIASSERDHVRGRFWGSQTKVAVRLRQDCRELLARVVFFKAELLHLFGFRVGRATAPPRLLLFTGLVLNCGRIGLPGVPCPPPSGSASARLARHSEAMALIVRPPRNLRTDSGS